MTAATKEAAARQRLVTATGAYQSFIRRVGIPSENHPNALAHFQRLADEMESADKGVEDAAIPRTERVA